MGLCLRSYKPMGLENHQNDKTLIRRWAWCATLHKGSVFVPPSVIALEAKIIHLTYLPTHLSTVCPSAHLSYRTSPLSPDGSI